MKRSSIRKLAATLILATFLVGIRNGFLALWRLDDPEPIHIFPFRVSVFPSEIRSALEKGIHVEESCDVGKLLQDMIS